MGLPIWRDYKEDEQKAKTKDAVKTDPTAATRSSIRRRDYQRREGFSGPPRPGTSLRSAVSARNAPGSERPIRVSRASRMDADSPRVSRHLPPDAARDPRRSRPRTFADVHQDVTNAASGDAMSAMTDVVPLSTLRREATIVQSPTQTEDHAARRPASSGISRANQSTSRVRSFGQSQDWDGHLVVPGDLILPGLEFPSTIASARRNRARSISPRMPEIDTGDHWEITMSTIGQDDSIPSTGSSSGGTAAANSLTSTVSGPSADTQLTDPWAEAEELFFPPSHERQPDECTYDGETASDSDFDEQDMALTRDEARTDAQDPRSPLNDDDEEDEDDDYRTLARMRREYQRLESRLQEFTAEYERNFRLRNRETATGNTGPGTQQPDRYGREILQRSRDAVREAHEFFRQASEALIVRPTSTQLTRPSRLADTRSDMQSSADLLGTFSESMRHGENDLETMRGILERLASREDIPDEWWMSAGLSRDTVRAVDSNAATGARL